MEKCLLANPLTITNNENKNYIRLQMKNNNIRYRKNYFNETNFLVAIVGVGKYGIQRKMAVQLGRNRCERKENELSTHLLILTEN